jgi:hypothetical protein
MSEIAAEQIGTDNLKNIDLMKDGRYRVANKNSEKYFYASQPANQKGGVNNADGSSGSGGQLMSNLTVGAEGKRAMEAAEMIHKQVEEHGGKVKVIDNSMNMSEIRKILSESEGLNIGNKRRAELIQTWRFMLASDPIQYGFDAGFVLGGVVAAVSLQWKKNRHPVRLASLWCAGFAVGMITFPMVMVGWEEYNMARIIKKENKMYQEQRDDYYKKESVVVDAGQTK